MSKTRAEKFREKLGSLLDLKIAVVVLFEVMLPLAPTPEIKNWVLVLGRESGLTTRSVRKDPSAARSIRARNCKLEPEGDDKIMLAVAKSFTLPC